MAPSCRYGLLRWDGWEALAALSSKVGILAIFKALDRSLGAKISDLIDRPRAMMVMFLA